MQEMLTKERKGATGVSPPVARRPNPGRGLGPSRAVADESRHSHERRKGTNDDHCPHWGPSFLSLRDSPGPGLTEVYKEAT
jgi:hypothetical protein